MAKKDGVKTKGGGSRSTRRRRLNQVAAEMPTEFLACRGGVHFYDILKPVAREIARDGVRETHYLCGHCHTLIRKRRDAYGYALPTKYNYAEGYLQKGMGRQDRMANAVYWQELEARVEGGQV